MIELGMSNAVMNFLVPGKFGLDWHTLLGVIWNLDKTSLKSMEDFGMVNKDGHIKFTHDPTILNQVSDSEKKKI